MLNRLGYMGSGVTVQKNDTIYELSGRLLLKLTKRLSWPGRLNVINPRINNINSTKCNFDLGNYLVLSSCPG